MPKDARFFSFVETTVFTKQVDNTGSLDVLLSIQEDLLANPKRGSVIQNTGGARKARLAKEGQGKRGGYRYIYVFLEDVEIIYLLLLYPKNEQDDLTPDQKKQVKSIVQRIKDSYKR
jgi:hypothetical protein